MRAPSDTDRTLILGGTGSGKSVFGSHLLSSRSWNRKPWVIVDYKRDELLEAIQDEIPHMAHEINPEDKLPKSAGLYFVRPIPEISDPVVDAMMRRIWERENIGFVVDEGFALPQTQGYAGFNLLLTQGRSKRIPIIALYQRPVWMSRFAVSQADFFAVFRLNDERDKKTVRAYVKPAKAPNGGEIGPEMRLPDYHCLWYDVQRDQSAVLSPAPTKDAILMAFKSRAEKRAGKGAFI